MKIEDESFRLIACRFYQQCVNAAIVGGGDIEFLKLLSERQRTGTFSMNRDKNQALLKKVIRQAQKEIKSKNKRRCEQNQIHEAMIQKSPVRNRALLKNTILSLEVLFEKWIIPFVGAHIFKESKSNISHHCRNAYHEPREKGKASKLF